MPRSVVVERTISHSRMPNLSLGRSELTFGTVRTVVHQRWSTRLTIQRASRRRRPAPRPAAKAATQVSSGLVGEHDRLDGDEPAATGALGLRETSGHGVEQATAPCKASRMRLPALLLVVVVAGCGEQGDRPGEVVRDYVQARDASACQYLAAAQAKPCRRPRAPEPPADRVVIEGVRIHEDRATIRASYDWTGYRRHATFTLVRREDRWFIARESPD
jgi:hypothetical protein